MSSTPTVSVREWTDVVRRARLGKTTKYIAVMMATYADYADGTRVFPGLERLAWAAEVDYKTAKKGVAELIAAGLIEVVGHSGTRERGTEYRLILGEDVLEKLVIPTPAQASMEIERRSIGRRRSTRTAHGTARPNGQGQPTGRPVPDQSAPEGRPTPRTAVREGQPTPRPQDSPPRSAIPTHYLDTTTTSHSDEELRTAVTHTRATGPPQDPDSPPMPERCEHGLASRLRKDGKPSCAICRRESAKPSATVLQLRPRSQPA